MIKVLHLFNDYLRQTENWVANLIAATPDARQTVAADRLLPTNFYSADVSYLQSPCSPLPNPEKRFLRKLFNRAQRTMSKGWPRVLANLAGPHDIMHAHFGPVGWRYRSMRRHLGCPLVVSFYGMDYTYVVQADRIWRQHYAELFRTADCFVCEGEYGASTLAALGCPRSKIAVCPLGVFPERIPVFSRRKPLNSLSLVQIAAITEKKGHIYTLRAFAEAAEDCAGMSLTLVGRPRRPGEEGALEALVAEAERLSIADQVRFVPTIDYATLHSFLADFHVFIHPSIHAGDGDCEGGAPVVLLDAQATGMPVIATTHCDIPSEVVHGESGLLAAEGDVPALAAAIRRFYRMGQDEYQQFANRARNHIETHYDLAHNAAALRGLYGDVIERHRRNRE